MSEQKELWSPFSSKWSDRAFAQYTSTSEQLFNQQEIIDQGFVLPDADGSKSSAFRQDAVLNNSFSEDKLRESLKDIYLNSSHKLTASNHDNVHFYHWVGKMSDATYIPHTSYCEISLPTEGFIPNERRDRYKISQYFRKWIPITELLNSWDVFGWDCMLFIGQQVYSDYELRIDDKETVIRFKYYDYWVRHDYPIYIYKFDTSYQCRVKISSYQMIDRWGWTIPLDYVDPHMANFDHCIVAINRVTDPEIRSDGKTNADGIGDNLEFVPIHDGYIDLKKMSLFNVDLIKGENKEWVWASLIVPKFFHEYPILLATDVVYRPYEPYLVPVMSTDKGETKFARVDKDEIKQEQKLYINMDDEELEWNDGWQYTIRPMVLADAFDIQPQNAYEDLYPGLRGLVDLTVEGADLIELFKDATLSGVDDATFDDYCDRLEDIMERIHTAHNDYLTSRRIELNDVYEQRYKDFLSLMPEIREDRLSSTWLKQSFAKRNDFWEFISPLIWIPRKLAEKYYVGILLENIGIPRIWEPDGLYGRIRYQRPVDPEDIWIFEYDSDKNVWRPYDMEIEHHFPDVYTLKDPNEESPTPERIFKAFFFYSDTMNPREESNPIQRPTPSWDQDVQAYEIDKAANYRDIFMEKFYWMGVRSIYKGIPLTSYRWEIIEYIQNNDSYKRFNQLFLNTMDPYFKMGMGEYLKSDNYQFPFDDAIDKMNEALTNQFLGYKKVTNFEVYLNKTWIPSYFDYVTRILDEYEAIPRLVHRPRDSFDQHRVLDVVQDAQDQVHESADKLNEELDWILDEIKKYGFNVSDSFLVELRKHTDELMDNIDEVRDFINNLDMEIYSIEDVNHIRDLLLEYQQLISAIQSALNQFRHNNPDIERVNKKLEILQAIDDLMSGEMNELVEELGNQVNLFDISDFMRHTSNPAFFGERDHYDDQSLIGYINQFNEYWPSYVQDARDNLYLSTYDLYQSYDSNKSYTTEEVNQMCDLIGRVKDDIYDLEKQILKFWDSNGTAPDDHITSHILYAKESIENLNDIITRYVELRDRLIDLVDQIRFMMISTEEYTISQTEEDYMHQIDELLDTLLIELGYIAGRNHIREANVAEDRSEILIREWLLYCQHELEVYTRMMNAAKDPNPFMEELKQFIAYMNALAEYLATLDYTFIPDTNVPNYGDVYEVDDQTIVSGGLLHKTDDIAYVPDMGSYQIVKTDDEVGSALVVNLLPYRHTTFVNPMWKNHPFDSITNGAGLGLTFEPASVRRTVIVDDSVVNKFMARINDLLILVKRDIDSINSIYNPTTLKDMESFESVRQEWDHTIEFYKEHLSEFGIETGNQMMGIAESLLTSLQELVDIREACDLGSFVESYKTFIDETYDIFKAAHSITQTFIYYDNRMRVVYDDAVAYYGDGRRWNDVETLKNVINNCAYEIKLFNTKMGSYLSDDDANAKIAELFEAMINQTNDLLRSIPLVKEKQVACHDAISSAENQLASIDVNQLQQDVWFEFKEVQIGLRGTGYREGDIIKLIQPDRDENEQLFIRITGTNEKGEVLEAVPLMDYALPYQIYGTLETEAATGDGTGLNVSVFSNPVGLSDSSLFYDETSDEDVPDQFDRNDLMVYTFANIHDLPVEYEIFLGGKQIRNFTVRHVNTDNPLHPEKVDKVYINANDVMGLMNSSVHLKSERYFLYRIDNVNVIDGGAGYHVGQVITVGSDKHSVQVRVTKLKDNPYKEIEEVEIVEGQSPVRGVDPSTDLASAVTDTTNNIDDEFHVSNYDLRTKEGVNVGASADPTLDKEQYPYIQQRWDDLDQDDRNSNYMYPTVEMPHRHGTARNGDPDGHWRQGFEANPDDQDHIWNRAAYVIPDADPFIPHSDGLPPGLPGNGEYQLIDRQLIHQIAAPMMTRIPDNELQGLVDGTLTPSEQGTFTTHEYEFESIPQNRIDAMNDEAFVPEPTPTVTVDGDVIKAIDVSRIRGLVYGDIVPELNPGPYTDDCIVEKDPTVWYDDVLQNEAMQSITISVANYASLPQHLKEWEGCQIGDCAVVEEDETYGGHRTLYRVRTFMITGYIVYDDPEIVDWNWNRFDIDWMADDFYPDLPTIKAQFPGADWYNTHKYAKIMRSIRNGDVKRVAYPQLHQGTYIKDLTVDDLSVYNFTAHKWEDLHDESRWKLTVRNNESDDGYGFTLTFIGLPEESYSYDMLLYLNKIPSTQKRNAELKRNATFNLSASILAEVNTTTRHYRVNTGRDLRIRKLFTYQQKQTFTVDAEHPYMEFTLASYMHFKNEIHAEDIIIYNKTLGMYEDVMDAKKFELQFKDPKAVARGYETQTVITQSMIADSGRGFSDGEAWAYNASRGIQVFGRITADFFGTGGLVSFIPIHCPNPPDDDVTLEFHVYQPAIQRDVLSATVLIEFQTAKVEVFGDGYLHNVKNPMAPVPKTFRIVPNYIPEYPVTYEVEIDKRPRTWSFAESDWKIFPVFHIDAYLNPDQIYVLTDKGRLPLINPSTEKPSVYVSHTSNGTDVMVLTVYKKYERFDIHATPYPMRSVYTQRRVPESGYIDLDGRINKPLDKKYFEFWMNGRLLNDEVTIISPTKIFLHGLKSLRNFEIVEINRDPNEYFSDAYLGVGYDQYGVPYAKWDYSTYLDDALEGTLEGDNYRPNEQELLLTPVWQQVPVDNPEFRNFPPNQDLEEDILMRVDDYNEMVDLSYPAYTFMVNDMPSIEGTVLSGKNTSFSMLGFVPMTDEDIIGEMNDEWKDEIEKGLIPSHAIVSDSEWYGNAVRMYDEYGMLVHELDDSAYKIIDTNILRINQLDKSARIIRGSKTYDLD